MPLVPPVGAVFAAWDSEAEIEEWAQRAGQNDPAEVRHYRRILELTRSRGYSVALRPPSVGYHLEELEGSGLHHVLMIAAPVFNGEGRALLAISLLDLPEPLSTPKLVEWGSRLRDVGLSVTRATRGLVPDGSDLGELSGAGRRRRENG